MKEALNVYRGHSGTTIRSHNRSLLLRLLLLHEPISRVELSAITGLTMPTVHGLTKELMEGGIVEELGTTEPQGGGAGRKAALLGLKPLSRLSIGVDLGVRTTRIGYLDIKGRIVAATQVIRHAPTETAAETLERVFAAIKRLSHGLPSGVGEVVGLGIGVPGLVDVATGYIRRTPNLGWQGIPIGEWFHERLSLPVMVDNNIRAMAIGEQMFGQGRGETNLIAFFVGPGIGAGILVNGQIFRGVSDGAGEVGHTLIDPAGPRCRCGRRGCLEAVASNTAILRRVGEAAQDGHGHGLRGLIGHDGSPADRFELTIEDVVRWAEEGNAYCHRLLVETGCLLGAGVANLINLFDPRLIIVGGELFNHGDVVFDGLVQTARRQALSGAAHGVALTRTGFGQNQGLVGAGALALGEFFYASSTAQTCLWREKPRNAVGFQWR